MLSWFLNPWMLLGTLAIASPILIHLLNKRRFKIVQWAAMDFLFDANKKNRRRVQVENFILLALRCLTMLLLAFMLARPLLPSSVTALVSQTQKVERVILVDDSLSQRVTTESQSSLDAAKASLEKMLTRLANSSDTEDWLTVMVTSDADQNLIDNQPLTVSTVSEHLQAINDIDYSDQVADYPAAMQRLRLAVAGDEPHARAAYVFSDMRRRDWMTGDSDDPQGADDAMAPAAIVESISDVTVGTFVVDTSNDDDGNLSIASIRSDGLLVANKVVNFIVEVGNFSDVTVTELKILFQIDDQQPQYQTVGSIAPGEVQQLVFPTVFKPVDQQQEFFSSQPQRTMSKSYRIRAEIDRQSLSAEAIAADCLPEDSSRLMAARVIDGIPVLLVDGDPSSSSQRSETHYLRSLEVLGTGLKMTTATISELETASLSDYGVIFLCNVDDVSPDRVKAIGQWVQDGGALVIMPGNRVRASTFNETFVGDGTSSNNAAGGEAGGEPSQGLSPLKLLSIEGDPTMATWTNFEVSPQVHPALRVIMDSDASSIGNVDVFSWWTSELVNAEPNVVEGDAAATESIDDRSDESGGGLASASNDTVIPLRLGDVDNSIAMVDRRLDRGRVIVFTIPGDGDWTMWPSSPTFAPVMVDLISYLAGSSEQDGSLTVGAGIRIPVDLTAYENRVTLRDPENEKMETVATPINPDQKNSVLYQAEFEDLSRRGFYDVQLTRHSGGADSRLVAVNYDARESQLKRVSPAVREDEKFLGEKVSVVASGALMDDAVDAGNSELWMMLLMLLMGVLAVEQFLGWFWGRKR